MIIKIIERGGKGYRRRILVGKTTQDKY